jgi:hypothetical protein
MSQSGKTSASRLPLLACVLLAVVWLHSSFFSTGVSTWQDDSSRGGALSLHDGMISFARLTHDGDAGGAYHWSIWSNRIDRSDPERRRPPPFSPRFKCPGFVWFHIPLPGQTVNRGAASYSFTRGWQDSVSVGLWVALLAAAPFPARSFLRRRTRARRRACGECLQCGYDLRSRPARCPECGSLPAAVPDHPAVTLPE